MKRRTNTTLILGSTLAVALALAVWAPARTQSAESADGKSMTEAKTMNMPDDMKLRCQMMMKTAIDPTDPAAILALNDDLKLTPDQVKKLQAIADKSRQDAKAVLDETQAKTVQAIPAKPETSMAMHQKMMEMMKKDMPDGQGAAQMPMMNCPMMKMMPGQMAPTAKP